jgi:hypothetical protein
VMSNFVWSHLYRGHGAWVWEEEWVVGNSLEICWVKIGAVRVGDVSDKEYYTFRNSRSFYVS